MNLPFIPDLKTAAIVALVVGIAAFSGGYKVADWRLTAKANAEAIERAQRAEKALETAVTARDVLAGKLATANDQHTEQLRKAQNETLRLRDRLYSGAIGLRIAANCPRLDANAEAPAGTRVDTGTGAELDSTSRRAYFALRDGIDRASAQLAACQDELTLRAGN